MFKTLVADLTPRSIRTCRALSIPKAAFSGTRFLSSKKDGNKGNSKSKGRGNAKSGKSKNKVKAVPPCKPEPIDPCCIDTNKKRNICDPPPKGTIKHVKSRAGDFVSMWEKAKDPENESEFSMWNYPPECCPVCEDVRFDALYYKPSNKCRDFQRTWWECCPRMVPKRVCCYCDALPPQKLKRCAVVCGSEDEKKAAAKACGDENKEEGELMKCIVTTEKTGGGCPRLTMPCCRAARIPPSCLVLPKPANCEKIKCPFPSFSECIKGELANLHMRPPECRCLETVPKCILNRELEGEDCPQVCPCPTCKTC